MYSVDAVDVMHCHQTVLRLVIVLLNVIMVQSPRRSIVSKEDKKEVSFVSFHAFSPDSLIFRRS